MKSLVKNKVLIIWLVLIVNGLLTSCSRQIYKEDILKSGDKLVIHFIPADKDLNRDTSINARSIIILPNTVKYKRFITWIEKNCKGWHFTPATYTSDIMILGDRFGMYYYKSGVVISFTDENGKPQQLMKKLLPNELDFIFE
jgi:hypothetical protein